MVDLPRSKAQLLADLKDSRKQYYAPRPRALNRVVDNRDGSWQCDTLFLPRKGSKRLQPVLNAVELTSKLGFAGLYRAPLGAPTGKESARILKELCEKQKVEHLTFDSGPEFNTSEVRTFCEDRAISFFLVDSSDLAAKGAIESFNKTCREWMTIHTEDFSLPWDQATLDAFCAQYNATRHSQTRAAPDVLAHDEAAQGVLRMKNTDLQQPYIDALNSFHPGDLVRVWMGRDPELSMAKLKAYSTHHKFGRRWTEKVYVVKDVGGREGGWRILLEGTPRRFGVRDLLKLDARELAEHEAGESDAEEKATAKAGAAMDRKRRRVANLLSRTGLHEAGRELLEPADGPLEAAFAEGQARPGVREAVTLRPREALRKSKRYA